MFCRKEQSDDSTQTANKYTEMLSKHTILNKSYVYYETKHQKFVSHGDVVTAFVSKPTTSKTCH